MKQIAMLYLVGIAFGWVLALAVLPWAVKHLEAWMDRRAR